MIKSQRTNKGKTYDVGVIDYEKEQIGREEAHWAMQGSIMNKSEKKLP